MSRLAEMDAHPLDRAQELAIVRSLARVVSRGWGLELAVERPEGDPSSGSVDVLVGTQLVGRVAARDEDGDGPSPRSATDPRLHALLCEVAASVAAHVAGRMNAEPSESYAPIVGTSTPMRALYATLDKVIASDSTVLIQGENGTGKELVARAIHRGSHRHGLPFVVQNCSAFNENLLDSELFGHKRGSFTGAVADKPGLFEVADRGTFFLDEIGDMSPALQVKVLRVLQEGTFTSVGDTEAKQVDVRILAATNRDLTSMVERGLFREDLFYRINVINLVVPPLRDRGEDIELLAETFLERESASSPGGVKRLADDARACLVAYKWPGNVRELENEIERAVVLAGASPVIAAELLSPRIAARQATASPANPRSLPDALRGLERRMIAEALERHEGNKTRAARELEVSRRNLIRLVQKYELDSQP